MGEVDFATIFKQAAKEAELQKLIESYRDKIDIKAFSAVAKAAFEAIVEKKPVEEVNERCMKVIKNYIVPRGKMTLPEYCILLESIGNVFLKYVQKKNKVIGVNKLNDSDFILSPTSKQKTLKSDNKQLKTIIVILIAFVWWIIVIIKPFKFRTRNNSGAYYSGWNNIFDCHDNSS